ncbi:hypothetical protein GH733_006778 [Mirounga leonina]|nr:hypothetical protein GH733_006778 [Mirounga leonina]
MKRGFLQRVENQIQNPEVWNPLSQEELKKSFLSAYVTRRPEKDQNILGLLGQIVKVAFNNDTFRLTGSKCQCLRHLLLVRRCSLGHMRDSDNSYIHLTGTGFTTPCFVKIQPSHPCQLLQPQGTVPFGKGRRNCQAKTKPSLCLLSSKRSSHSVPANGPGSGF